MHRTNIFNKLYTGICEIYEHRNLIDNDTRITKSELILIQENIPCRVSYYKNRSNLVYNNENTFNHKIKQVVKVFLSNSIDVKAGSVLVITQNGKTTKYKNSSEPIIYSNHQEIVLEIYDNIV